MGIFTPSTMLSNLNGEAENKDIFCLNRKELGYQEGGIPSFTNSG
jgi:hypothetical protein